MGSSLADLKRTYYLNALGLPMTSIMTIGDLEYQFFKNGGGGGSSSSLTVVNGGTVTLDDAKPEGFLTGFEVKSTTTFVAASGSKILVPGTYTFKRTSTSWVYYTAATSSSLDAPVGPDPTWTVTDSFTAANGTSLNGRSTQTGAKTYQAPVTFESQGNNDWGVINNNAIDASDSINRSAIILMTTANVVGQLSYDLSAGGGSSSIRAALWLNTLSEPDALAVHLRGNGALFCFKGSGTDITLTGVTTGIPLTGTLRVQMSGTSLTITTSAGTATATVATGTGYSGTGRRMGFAAGGAGAKIDDIKAAEL